jgi:predicted P-loop ATPase
MLVAAVRRVRQPGCKFDYITVFEGAQGSGRSTALKVLAGGEDNFSDAEIIMQAPKERQEQIQGVWIYELAELAGYGRVDVNRFKNFVTQTVDRARPAFGRNRVDRPRRCIFVGTTNDDDYLRDESGNRRYWPVRLRDGWRIDLDRLAEVKDDLWAEAATIEASGEPLVIPEALWPQVAAEQAKRMQDDPWLGPLAGLVAADRGYVAAGLVDGSQTDPRSGEPEWRVATTDLLEQVLGVPRGYQNTNYARRLAGLMRRLGWEKPDGAIRINRKVTNGFRRPKAQEAL